MSEQTVDQQIAEIHQRLAEKQRKCLTCQTPMETINGWQTAIEMGLMDCPTCHGTGKVPLLPKLRRECPCIYSVITECEGCHASSRIGGCSNCNRCDGKRWVLSPSDTDTLYDALGELGEITRVEVLTSSPSSLQARIRCWKDGWLEGNGKALDRRLAQWLAAKNLVTNMRKEEGAK